MNRIIKILLIVIFLIGNVSNPLAEETELQTLQFKAVGMDSLTSTEVEGALKQLPGIVEATADWKPGKVTVRYNPEQIMPEEIMDTVSGMGYYVEQAPK